MRETNWNINNRCIDRSTKNKTTLSLESPTSSSKGLRWTTCKPEKSSLKRIWESWKNFRRKHLLSLVIRREKSLTNYFSRRLTRDSTDSKTSRRALNTLTSLPNFINLSSLAQANKPSNSSPSSQRCLKETIHGTRNLSIGLCQNTFQSFRINLKSGFRPINSNK